MTKENNNVIPFTLRTSSEYYFRGMAYAESGNIVQAIEDYARSIELDPMNADAYDYRGRAYFFSGEYTKTIEDSNQAINLGTPRPLKIATRP